MVWASSIWVFLLLGIEAIRTYRLNPYLIIGTHQVPTWTTPLFVVLVVSALVPNTSLLGHLCGLAVGYLCTSCFYAARIPRPTLFLSLLLTRWQAEWAT